MPNFSYTCLPSGLDHLIVNVIIYVYTLLHRPFPKSGTNELNSRQKRPNISQSDSGQNDLAETTGNRNHPDSAFRLKVLDLIFMGKKEPIVHRHFTKTITNRFAGLSRRIITVPNFVCGRCCTK